MTVEHIEVLVEEPSMEVALRELLPRMLGGVTFEVYAHQCKADLLTRLPSRLHGYSKWLPPNWRVVIVVDRDQADCQVLKAELESMAQQAGLPTRSSRSSGRYLVVNRIAIEELEAWYFGDWQAVHKAYPRVTENVASKAPYRDPDAIGGGTWETFERILKHAGYFSTGLRKIEAARQIAPYMDPGRNRSHSFMVLRDALLEMAAF